MNLSPLLLSAAISGIILGAVACSHDTPGATDPSATTGAKGMTAPTTPGAKHACKGQNDCKGQGGCKTDKHACKGQNDCKGQGGCRTDGKS